MAKKKRKKKKDADDLISKERKTNSTTRSFHPEITSLSFISSFIVPSTVPFHKHIIWKHRQWSEAELAVLVFTVRWCIKLVKKKKILFLKMSSIQTVKIRASDDDQSRCPVVSQCYTSSVQHTQPHSHMLQIYWRLILPHPVWNQFKTVH